MTISKTFDSMYINVSSRKLPTRGNTFTRYVRLFHHHLAIVCLINHSSFPTSAFPHEFISDWSSTLFTYDLINCVVPVSHCLYIGKKHVKCTCLSFIRALLCLEIDV